MKQTVPCYAPPPMNCSNDMARVIISTANIGRNRNFEGEQMSILTILTYLAIFAAKLIEVSLATMRTVLINRGVKLVGAAIGFFEVLIWISVVSYVLVSITEDPFKVIVYALAFSCGNYLGATIEGKLALGIACIQVMLPEGAKDDMKELMYAHGFGATFVQAHGTERAVDLMIIYLKRKRVPEVMRLIRDNCPDALMTVNDVRQLRNGFIMK